MTTVRIEQPDSGKSQRFEETICSPWRCKIMAGYGIGKKVRKQTMKGLATNNRCLL